MHYFANMRIQKVIIHEIYKREDDGTIKSPRYNNQFTQLNPAGLQTLQNRIVNALGDNSHSIEMTVSDDSPQSTFQSGAKLFATDDEDVIEASKQIAYNLAQSQTTKSIPGGIVLLFAGITGLNNNNFWGIIKAEVHEGFTKKIDSEALILEYVNDLLLTPQQKLYKIGVFLEIGVSEPIADVRLKDDFSVFVFDHNMTRNETQHAAYYFYRDFLGCDYSPTSKKLTSDFYYNTKNFIKTAELDDEIKGELNTALFTYMKVSNEATVHVDTFADAYLSDHVKQSYVDYMTGQSFPTHAVEKDLSYIKNKLKQRKVTFTNNVKIIAPADNFNNLLTIQQDPSHDQTIVTIKGTIEQEELK